MAYISKNTREKIWKYVHSMWLCGEKSNFVTYAKIEKVDIHTLGQIRRYYKLYGIAKQHLFRNHRDVFVELDNPEMFFVSRLVAKHLMQCKYSDSCITKYKGAEEYIKYVEKVLAKVYRDHNEFPKNTLEMLAFLKMI